MDLRSCGRAASPRRWDTTYVEYERGSRQFIVCYMAKMNSYICKTCNKRTLHVQTTPNHVLHLLLSVVTIGLWLIVWLLITVFKDDSWRCSECGTAASGAGWGMAGAIYRSFEQMSLERKITAQKKVQCRVCGFKAEQMNRYCTNCGKQLAF